MRNHRHIGMLALFTLAQVACQGETVSPEEERAAVLNVKGATGGPSAIFMFDYPPAADTYCVQLTDAEKIAHARGLIAGTVKDRPHIQGKVIKSRAPYNEQWGSYLDPSSVSFFSSAIEVCDASIAYLQANLPQACGSFLPNCAWCPWGSRLIQEVPTMCIFQWDPVCGRNGKTYSNACAAGAACVPVACQGMCPCRRPK